MYQNTRDLDENNGLARTKKMGIIGSYEESFAALNLSSFDLCEPTRVYDGFRI